MVGTKIETFILHYLCCLFTHAAHTIIIVGANGLLIDPILFSNKCSTTTVMCGVFI